MSNGAGNNNAYYCNYHDREHNYQNPVTTFSACIYLIPLIVLRLVPLIIHWRLVLVLWRIIRRLPIPVLIGRNILIGIAITRRLIRPV